MKATIFVLGLAAAILWPTGSPAQETGRGVEREGQPRERALRRELDSLERHLDHAVARVSAPHAGILLGRVDTVRGYRLPGYGVVLVLPPRALPRERAAHFVRRETGPDARVRAERHVVVPEGEPGWEPEQVEELERQVVVLQHATEEQRRAAEEDMERIVRDIRIRLAPHAEEDTPGASSDATPPDPPLVPGVPPWKFWFDVGAPEENRSVDEVVEDVRGAVIEALDARPPRIVGLRGEEFVTVAVDFVPGGFFATSAGPTRTLIVRARHRDLEARARGAIASAELRERVEVIEY